MAQTYEVVADTDLRAEWAALTATWVPSPAVPADRRIRFLGDPEFRAADRVLLVLEKIPPSSTRCPWGSDGSPTGST